jgi:hypothetical protein
MRMTNRYAQRIGRIGTRHAGQQQQPLHHVLHLLLLRLAVTDDGLLDLQGSVFGHEEIGADQSANGRAARLPEQQRRLRMVLRRCGKSASGVLMVPEAI